MKNKTLEIVLFVIILGIALLSRSVEVLNKNYLFGFDPGRDYLAVKDIVVNKNFTLIGSEWGAGSAGFSGLFHGPFYYYSLIVPFIIFRGDPYGGLVLMFAFSIGAVIMGYVIGRSMLGKGWGFLTALLLAISPPLISSARFIWNSHPSPFFILIAFYYIYRMTKDKGINIFLSSFFSGFIYNFQSGIAIPLSFTLFIYALFIVRLRKINEIAYLLLGYFLAFLPLLMFNLRHDFISFKGLTSYAGNVGQAVFSLGEKSIMRDHFNSFASSFFNSFPTQQIIPSILFFLFFLLATIILVMREKSILIKKFVLFLILLPLITFFVFAFLRNTVWGYYLLHLNIAYALLFAYIFYSSFKKNILILKIIFIGILGIFLIRHTSWAIKNFIADYSDYGGIHKIKGKLEALDYIYKDAGGKKFGLLVFTPPVYTYAYDYLIWWYGNKKYKYVPYQEKKGTFYLLMEPDSSKPWSYEGWLETVIKAGTILETKELRSGFIIQKRYVEEKNKI